MQERGKKKQKKKQKRQTENKKIKLVDLSSKYINNYTKYK